MKIGLLLIVFAMLLSGCSSAPTRWTKFDYSHAQFEADWGECKTQGSPEQCMSAKGYTADNQ